MDNLPKSFLNNSNIVRQNFNTSQTQNFSTLTSYLRGNTPKSQKD